MSEINKIFPQRNQELIKIAGGQHIVEYTLKSTDHQMLKASSGLEGRV